MTGEKNLVQFYWKAWSPVEDDYQPPPEFDELDPPKDPRGRAWWLRMYLDEDFKNARHVLKTKGEDDRVLRTVFAEIVGMLEGMYLGRIETGRKQLSDALHRFVELMPSECLDDELFSKITSCAQTGLSVEGNNLGPYRKETNWYTR